MKLVHLCISASMHLCIFLLALTCPSIRRAITSQGFVGCGVIWAAVHQRNYLDRRWWNLFDRQKRGPWSPWSLGSPGSPGSPKTD